MWSSAQFGDMLADNLVKFVLVSVLGGGFTAYLAWLRDRAARNESILIALRKMNIEIDDLYRSSKQTKRMLRSRLKCVVGKPAEAREYEIDAKFFAERMYELSSTQLKMEQLKNALRTRSDLFDDARKGRILAEITYSDVYLHDVVEEFEKRKPEANGDMRLIGPESCKMLTDYLDIRFRPDRIRQGLDAMVAGKTGIERYEAFIATVRVAKEIAPEHWHRKSISDQAILLAIREVRDAIEECGRRRIQFWRRPRAQSVGSKA